MEIDVHTKRYRVEPSKKFDISECDPNDTSGFEGSEEEAKKESERLDVELDKLQEKLFAEHKHKVLVVFQAMDTGGKDGTIRRIFRGVNPAGVSVAHFKVPTQEEMDHDFLWRVHARTPGNGEIAIFNRSHYESVLVERVHGLIDKEEWENRYRLINDFEKLLSQEGTLILKFYLNIDEEEQKKRLQERLKDPDKEWKFSADDLSERKLWKEYMKAYEEAIGGTSTEQAPWYVIPANHKWFRDLVVAGVLVKSLSDLDMKYPKLPDNLRSAAVA